VKLVTMMLLGAALISANAQELIVQDKSFVSRDLSGTVEDPSGSPLENAKVDLISCSSSYRDPKILRSMKSGPDGRFGFSKRPFVNEYCMQISKDGFDQLRFSVVIRKTERTLHVKLPIAA